MKRALAGLLAILVLSLVLSACDKKKGKTTTTTTGGQSTTAGSTSSLPQGELPWDTFD